MCKGADDWVSGFVMTTRSPFFYVLLCGLDTRKRRITHLSSYLIHGRWLVFFIFITFMEKGNCLIFQTKRWRLNHKICDYTHPSEWEITSCNLQFCATATVAPVCSPDCVCFCTRNSNCVRQRRKHGKLNIPFLQTFQFPGSHSVCSLIRISSLMTVVFVSWRNLSDVALSVRFSPSPVFVICWKNESRNTLFLTKVLD